MVCVDFTAVYAHLGAQTLLAMCVPQWAAVCTQWLCIALNIPTAREEGGGNRLYEFHCLITYT